MTFGSLFAGIGGIDLGLERAGMQCRWQVEIDPFCQEVLAKHWPDVRRYGDITKLDGSELEPVDLIAGGFPCTNTSNAGDRTGLDGEHSARWFDMLRLVRRLRPFHALVENPTGLLARGMGEVLGGLAECGYDAEWQVLPAAAFGAKHERERLFIVAYPERAGLEGNQCRILAGWEYISRHAARCSGSFAGIASRKDGASRSWILRGVHGVPDRMDRVRALGSAVVPQVAEWIGRRIMEHAR